MEIYTRIQQLNKDGPSFYILRGDRMLDAKDDNAELNLKPGETLRVQGRLRGGATGQHIVQLESPNRE